MLMRFDPIREFDRLTDEVWGNGRRRRIEPMAMDAYRDDDHFVVNFDLPGVDPDSIDVTVEKNIVKVTAQRSFDRPEERQWLAHERPEGTFERQLFLGDTLDADSIDAHYDRGVLTLTVGVAEQAKPRKITVVGGDGRQAIDAVAKSA